MTPAAKCKRLATMLRVKAELERDPEIRAEWKCIARGYLILANQIERNGFKEINYASFARICDFDEVAWFLFSDDDLLDNRPEVYQKAKTELLARLANTKKERLIELVAMEAKHSKPASD